MHIIDPDNPDEEIIDDVVLDDEPADGEEVINEGEGADDELADGDGGDDGRDWEKDARAQGWRPDGPKSAQQFVEDGERYAPTLKKKYEGELAGLRAEMADQAARLERMNRIALDRQRAQLEASYNNAERDAAEIADVEAFDRIRAGREKALSEFDAQIEEVNQPAQQQPQGRQISPNVLISWKERNPWFESPDAAPETNFAIGVMDQLMQKYPNAAPDDLLPHVDAKLKASFPTLYGGSERRQPRSLTDKGGRRRPAPGKAPKLPADVMAQAKADVAAGLYKDVAEWAKVYNEAG